MRKGSMHEGAIVLHNNVSGPIDYNSFKMAFEIDSKTAKWLSQLQIVPQQELKQTSTSTFQIKEATANGLENGTKVSQIVQEIYKKVGLPIPQSLNHLKISSQTAAQLYNWNIINEALRKIDFEIDPETKNMIINGDREHLAATLRRLHQLYLQQNQDLEDSLDTQQFRNQNNQKTPHDEYEKGRQSLTLSKSEEPVQMVPVGRKNSEQLQKLQKLKRLEVPSKESVVKEGDLLEYVITQLMECIGITRQQAITLLQDNNKYLAHVLVKGVKGEFGQIEQLMERWLKKMDFIVQRMADQNDMCFFFLQLLKPALLSKSEQVAQWACRLLSRIAHQLANKDLLPLAYDWFVRDAGGLSTSVLALSRHPKLNQQVVGFMLQFARFNIAQLFTVELRKVTSQDQLSYVKFMLLIFDPLVNSKMSAQELLSSGAIDYWVQSSLKGAQASQQNSVEMRLYSIELLAKLWRVYPIHVQESLDKVNEIMGFIKKGIRQSSQIMRFTLLQLLFNLLDEFASKKNPYASVVYKKLTFLFIENHEELNVREFMLRNFAHVFKKYQSMPVEIFLEPFVKQVKIRQSKSYFLNIFDFQFIEAVISHNKLRAEMALQLFDLLAKTKLNNYEYASLTDNAMATLLDRFLAEDIFLQYTAKLVKISLAIFYSTFKHKKRQIVITDQQRLNAQKRAEIINFVINLVERNSSDLNSQILQYVIRLKVQIQRKLSTTHKGIERILSLFPNAQQEYEAVLQKQAAKEETQSNMSSQNSKDGFRFPKLQQKYLSRDRDQVNSQQSIPSQGTAYSNKTKQEFPQKDYTKFAEQDEQKFLKEYGIGFKKKIKPRQMPAQVKVNPKVQQQIDKTKLRKQQQQKKKMEEQAKIKRKKQLLINKIQKELEQRNLMQGIKGFEKDVEVRVVFQENELNQKLIQDEDLPRMLNINQQQSRDCESIKIILKKYSPFLKRIFSKYSSAKVNKKDFFQEDNENLAQIDLIRMCKEKNLQKNKQVIIELIKLVNDKNLKSLTFDNFLKFLEVLTINVYIKQKMSTHLPMGDLVKNLIKKLAVGENFKLQEDEDQTSRNLTQKVKYNPHIQLPQGYKKVYERVYEPKRQCSYPVKKSLGSKSFIDCFQVVNDLLFNIFKFHTLEEEVRFFEEGRVVRKNLNLPPRPIKKEKQREEPISLLADKEPVPVKNKRSNSTAKQFVINKTTEFQGQGSLDREKENSKPKAKVLNAIEKKKVAEEEAKRAQKEKEQQQFKRRQQEIKKRMQKMQEQKERQKSKQKQDTKGTRQQEQQKKKKQKQEKERYHKEQKQKIEKYKRQRQQKQKQEKQKQKSLKIKQDQQKKQKLKQQMKRQQQKRKEQAEKSKKQRQLSQQKNKKKKQQQQKKKQQLKKQVLKKLEGQKQKYEIQKMYKELMKKIYQQSDIQTIFDNFKDELKSLYNYGKQYNEYKLGDKQNALEQKGWLTLTQQFSLCDASTANTLLKLNQKQKGRSGFLYEEFLETLMGLAVKKDVQANVQDYEIAHKLCGQKLQKYVRGLKIPKDKQSMNDYFVSLKNNLKKKEVQVKGPSGQKQTWQIQQK